MTMDIIDKRIYSCNEAICKNIESLQANERGLLSQNILSQLRNFLECVFLKIYVASGNSLIESNSTKSNPKTSSSLTTRYISIVKYTQSSFSSIAKIFPFRLL